jgi:predicted secreted protein
MQPITFVAIYFLLWFFSLFLVLPFGVRTADEEGVAKVPGQADSAPAYFHVWRVFLRTSLLAAAMLLLFYLNYRFGWINAGTFDRFYDPPGRSLK